MTRSEAAFLRAVRHHAAKIDPAAAISVAAALRLYEAWATPKQAAEQLVAARTTGA